MCVIIYAPIGIKFNKGDLQDAWDMNSDGGGIAWTKDGVVSYSKGYETFNDFWKNMKGVINDTSMDRVIHFRITSRGKTSKTQTHPFLLSDNSDDTKILDYMGTRPVLFMNGTITSQKLITGLNDTASFIIDTLYDSSLSFTNEADLRIIDKLTGSKWAIMTTEGVSLVGDFTLMNGLYYSNTYHTWLSYTGSYSDYKKSSKKSKKSNNEIIGEAYMSDYYYDLYGSDDFDYEEEYYNYYGSMKDDCDNLDEYEFIDDNKETVHYDMEDLVSDDANEMEECAEALRTLFETDEGKQTKIRDWFDGTLTSIKQLYQR